MNIHTSTVGPWTAGATAQRTRRRRADSRSRQRRRTLCNALRVSASMRRCERVAGHVNATDAAATTAASSAAAILALPQLSADVVASAQHLQVDTAALEAFADALTAEAIDALSPPPPSESELMQRPEERAALLLAQMAVNFCYFPYPGDRRWWIVSRGEVVGQDDEANAMSASLRDAWMAQCATQGGGFASGRYLSELTDADVAAVFNPAPEAGALPMLAERASALRELGMALAAAGGAAAFVAAASGSALRFCGLLAEHCPGFDDRRDASDAPYGVLEPLCFLKRAQLCAAALNGAGMEGFTFDDVDQLTVFSDYR